MSAGILVVVVANGRAGQHNQKEGAEDDDPVQSIHNRKVIFIRSICHRISYDKYSSFYLRPTKISRIRPPTIKAVDIIMAVALTMSLIPNSFINTTNVATQGK